MKRSSSDRVYENPWNDGQHQEPAKKAKPDDENCIEPTSDLLVGENAGNGDTNSGENGHRNEDTVAHEINDIRLGDENAQFVHEKNENNAEVEALGSADESEKSSIIKIRENGAAFTNVTGDQADRAVETEEEKESNENVVEEESIQLRLSEEQETESDDAAIVSQAIEEPTDGTWDRRLFHFSELRGHSFRVNAVDMVGNILVSASDDTTVKAWSLETKSLICTLSGHKESVKAVHVLDLTASKDFAEDGNVVISGSADCCAKFWHIPSGKELRSIYTYNAINAIGYIPFEALLVIGTDGGKLELFDAKTSASLSSILVFELPIITMKVNGNIIICGDPQGRLQAWIVKDRKLHCRRTSNALETSRPSMSAIASYGTDLIAGLLSGSIKRMTWTNGLVTKLRNRFYGDQIDTLEVINELMVYTTSADDAYYVHFYNLSSGVYLGSVVGKNQMKTVAAVEKDGILHVAAGGDKLHLWELGGAERKELDNGVTSVTLLPQAALEDSDSESEGEDKDSANHEEEENPSSRCCVM